MVRKLLSGDTLVLLVLATLSVLYAWEAYLGSAHLYNLILVAPLTAGLLIGCALQFFLGSSNTQPLTPVREVAPVMGLFAAYVLSLNWLGFDVGTFAFIAVFLWLHGERRWLWLLAYSVAFASLAALFFSFMLPYPMPLLLLGGLV